jgi:hypothetical protein
MDRKIRANNDSSRERFRERDEKGAGTDTPALVLCCVPLLTRPGELLRTPCMRTSDLFNSGRELGGLQPLSF